MTTFPINPLPAGVTSKPTVTFLNQGSTSTNYLTYTFTGRSLGVDHAILASGFSNYRWCKRKYAIF